MPCEMYFTSGTSGRSKGVLLSHEIVHSHALHCIAEHRFTAADVWLHVAPMFHLVDAFAMFAITAVCGKHVLLPGAFDAERTLDAMCTQGITATNMATSMVNLLLASPASRSMDGRFPRLRLVSCGGAPLSKAALLRAQRLFGCEFFQSYGMTECCGKVSMSMLNDRQRALPMGKQLEMLCSSGKPFQGIDVRVCDPETGEPIAPNGTAVGEVQLRGPTVFQGYLRPNQESATQDAEHFLPGGWFRTGDLATLSQEGFLRVIDRLKDMILVGSENVYCIEVENALAAHPSVALCSVYGVPGPEMIGEFVKAVVMLREGASQPSPEELQTFCSTRLADFKIPRIIEYVRSMPLNGSGKVIKAELKKRDQEPRQEETTPDDVDCQDINEHCYQVQWQRKFLTPPAQASAGQWLVLSAGSESVPVSDALVAGVVEQFRASGVQAGVGQCSYGDWPMVHDFAGMEAPSGLCLLLPAGSMVEQGPEADAKVRLAVQRGLGLLLAAIRASEARQIRSILVASQHPQQELLVAGRPVAVDPALAACWSFVRAAAAESQVAWRLVELCSHASAADAASTIVAEAHSTIAAQEPAERSEEVVWSQGQRFVPRLQLAEQVSELAQQLPRAGYIGPTGDGSSCVVVGGSGSLGRLLISCLAKCGQLSDIVIVSRRQGSKSTFGKEAAESPCQIQFMPADTSDLDSCRNLMRSVKNQSAPCSHILNLAGFLPDSGMVPVAKDLRWADCVPVLRPKVDGTLNLATASDEILQPETSLVCFSSIFGVLSYPRLAPYGAANGFQDGLMELRSASGKAAQAVAWGAWAETGMAHRAGAGFHAYWASEGMGFVPPRAGMELLCRLLASKNRIPPQICVFPAASAGPWPSGLSRHVLARGIATADEAEVDMDADEVEAPGPALATDIRAVVTAILGSLLACEAGDVPMDEPFATVGVTSMMAVDLTARVGKARTDLTKCICLLLSIVPLLVGTVSQTAPLRCSVLCCSVLCSL